jgi:hypothetical protein
VESVAQVNTFIRKKGKIGSYFDTTDFSVEILKNAYVFSYKVCFNFFENLFDNSF